MGDSCKKFVVPTEVSKWCHFTHTFEFTFCQHWVLFMQMRMTFEDVCNIICCSLAQAWHGTSTSRGGHCVSQSCHRNEQHVLGMVTHTTRYSVHLTMQCPRKERDEMSGCTREMTLICPGPPSEVIALAQSGKERLCMEGGNFSGQHTFRLPGNPSANALACRHTNQDGEDEMQPTSICPLHVFCPGLQHRERSSLAGFLSWGFSSQAGGAQLLLAT